MLRKKRRNRRLAGHGRAFYGETNLCPACDIVEHRAAVTGNAARPTYPLWFAILFSLISFPKGFEGFRLREGRQRESVRVREAPCEGVPEPCAWLARPCARIVGPTHPVHTHHVGLHALLPSLFAIPFAPVYIGNRCDTAPLCPCHCLPSPRRRSSLPPAARQAACTPEGLPGTATL